MIPITKLQRAVKFKRVIIDKKEYYTPCAPGDK